MRTALLALFAALLVGAAALACADEEGGAAAAPEVRKALIRTSLGDIEVELWPKVAPHTVEVFLGLAEGKGTFTDVASPEKRVTIAKPYYDGLIFHRVIKGFMLQGGCPNGNGSGDPGFKFADEINAKALGLDKEKVVVNGQPHRWIAGLGQENWQQNVLRPVIRLLQIDVTKLNASKQLQQQVMDKLQSMTLKELYELQGYKYDDHLPSVAPRRGHLALANAGPNTNGSQFFINVGDPEYLAGRHTVFGRVSKGMDVVDRIAGVAVAPGSYKPLEDVKILSIREIR